MLKNILYKTIFSFFVCSFLLLSVPAQTFAQATTNSTIPTTVPNEIKDTAPATEDASCISWSGFNIGACLSAVFNFVVTGILKVINWLLSYVLWFASFVFDFAFYFTVVKFKNDIGDLQAGGIGTLVLGNTGSSLVYYLWGMIRDFLNIIIFLTIMYSAVYSMFDGFENTRKKFISLLIFSIIANFSLLFVKIAIDVSNILTIQAYTLAVKPAGADTFAQFRSGDTPKTIGEYIMNSVDMNALSDQRVGIKAASEKIADIKNTFMFQLGRIIVQLGVIYLLIFMAGLLMTRGLILLYAMIISPLIAADIFFGMMGGTKETEAIANGVRNITSKVRGDFYDSLIKGPVLIFFLFLIGVLAESIMSQDVMKKLSDGINSMKDVKANSNVFTDSIFIFFKFAMFLLLCQLLFNALNKIKLGGEQGTRLRAYGGRFANYAFGRGVAGLSRAGGALGRNTLGRAAANTNGRFGSALQNLNNRADAWKSSEFFLKRAAGNLVGGATKGIREGSYDLRASKALDNKLGLKIKTATEGVAGYDEKNPAPKGFGMKVGEAEKFGFEAGIDDRRKKAAEKIKKDAEDAAKAEGLMATKEMIQDVKREMEVTFGGNKMKLGRLEEMLADEHSSGGELNLTGDNLTKFNEALTKYREKDPNILNEIEDARSKAETIAIKKEGERRAKKIIEEGVEGKRTGSSLTQIAGDYATGNRSVIYQGVRQELAKNVKKGVKEDAKKAVIFRGITSELNEVYSNLQKSLDLNFSDPTSPEFKNRQENLAEIQNILMEISPKGLTDEEKIKLFEKYASDPAKRGLLVKVKRDADENLSNFLSTDVIDKVEKNISDLEVNFSNEKNDYLKKAQKRSLRDMEAYLKSINSMSSSVNNYEDQAKKMEEQLKATFEPKIEKPAEDKKGGK